MPRRACLRVTGDEATHFLQNLVTCEIEALGPGDLTFGALLTPQGKVLFDFFVLREAEGYLFDTPAEARDALRQRLAFYKLRAAVAVEDDARGVVTGEGLAPDPRSPALPGRGYEDGPEAIDASYDAARIEAGVPEAGLDYAYGEVFPHDAGFDRYARPGAGVAFRKGCYVGQEVVSRMQHRGTARRRPIVLEFDAAVPTGAAVMADEREIGTVGTVAGEAALAIVRLDRAESAGRLTVDGVEARWKPSPLLAA